jgi:hypothetical protein
MGNYDAFIKKMADLYPKEKKEQEAKKEKENDKTDKTRD